MEDLNGDFWRKELIALVEGDTTSVECACVVPLALELVLFVALVAASGERNGGEE